MGIVRDASIYDVGIYRVSLRSPLPPPHTHTRMKIFLRSFIQQRYSENRYIIPSLGSFRCVRQFYTTFKNKGSQVKVLTYKPP